jgi:hypothetical protein
MSGLPGDLARERSALGARDDALKDFAAECYYDPLKWVLAIYPWGKEGTFLAEEQGPDEWQCEVLQAAGQELLLVDTGRGLTNTAQLAIGSGHGTGKTCLEAWMIQWWLSTRRSPAMNCTAGTDTQLKTKLWRELNKWHAVSANRDWFEWTATSFKMRENPLSVANAIPWSEHNAQAFAGLHEADPGVIFEEASAVGDSIWTTQEGAFTTAGGLWLVVGNLTEASGAFYDCFNAKRKYWRTFNIDARRAKKADKRRIAQWLDTYGEDSDFFRVRVMGQPPKGGASRLITVDAIEQAVARELEEEWIHEETPLVMGIDPAGGGASVTAIVMRRGPLVKDKWIIRFSEPNHMRVASIIAGHLSTFRPDYAFIDAHGMGKGVFDRLQQLGYHQVTDVYGGDRSAVLDPLNYFNPRAEWWGRMANWLKVSRVPNDRDLRDELLRQPMEVRQMKLHLMSKEEMRKAGLESPDTADALSLTFAEIVHVKRNATSIAIEGGLPAFT